jgi:hypothetical protein
MKRPIKPFVVEVRKGSKNQKKKTPVTDLLPIDMLEEKPRENGVLKRAEAALFKAVPKAEESGAASRSGRILESIAVAAQQAEEPVVETKRRGRPPGSRNKPREFKAAKPEGAEGQKRRGRPPKVVEGAVRKVQLTPELASAALESIAKAGVMRPVPPIISAQEKPKKLPRIKPTRAPRAAQQPIPGPLKKKTPVLAAARKRAPDHPPAPSAPPSAPAPATMRPSSPLDRLPRMLSMATEIGRNDPLALFAALYRPKAGQRWRRRLRGAAFFAYERRQRKSIPTPR